MGREFTVFHREKKRLNSGVRYFFFRIMVKLDEKQQSSIEVVSSCVSRELYVLKK